MAISVITLVAGLGPRNACAQGTPSDPPLAFRPPAVPLLVRTPYLSIWQPADTLPGTWPTFWNGDTKAITGIIRIDDKAYVFMGNPRDFADGKAQDFPLRMVQSAFTITPTQTRYSLTAGGVELDLDFLSPVEPSDLRRQSLPFGYLFAQAFSRDGKRHRVSLYFDISAEWAHGDNHAPVTAGRESVPGTTKRDPAITAVTVTAANPKELSENRDYPSWGTAVFAAAQEKGLTSQIGPDELVRPFGARHDGLDGSLDANLPRAINDHWPVLAFEKNLGGVAHDAPSKPFTLILGHVREPAVSYMGKAIAPLWKSYFPTWQQAVAFVARCTRGPRQSRYPGPQGNGGCNECGWPEVRLAVRARVSAGVWGDGTRRHGGDALDTDERNQQRGQCFDH